ncbi:hypothetical protein CYMTET_54682 [Cymbomonas tetramitiformis]|uniref:Uncharacterized protein n=1 Tax=Cymbomonas tetramitiformis TaxID=36881 RepID=A0AAE0BEE2_9CHLO|nr:hypothetical protein CYMTET_54682 [Cymbomonas tetramitiformis]
MRTNLPRLNPEQLRVKMTEWEARLVPREEIHRQLSLHPLTRINETETTGPVQGEEEEEPQDLHARAQTKWIDEIDPMAEKMETCCFEKGQTIDKPKEIVAVRTLPIDPTDPHSLAWPTLRAGNLTLDPTETNPEQDIADNREHHCQLRLEGELAHSYHRNGKYIGTLTKEKLLRLHERYTQAVGITHHQTPHQRTLRMEMWEDHKIQVSTFEEEIGGYYPNSWSYHKDQ